MACLHVFQKRQICLFLIFSWRIVVSGEPKEYSSDLTCVNGHADCVCIVEGLLRDLKHLLLWDKGTQLEEKIKKWECKRFIRLPKKLEIDTNEHKVNLIYNSNSQNHFQKRNGNGRGEGQRRRYERNVMKPTVTFPNHIYFGAPTNEAFEAAIAQVDPKGFHQYAIFGASVKLECIGSGEAFMELEGRIQNIVWTHLNGDPIHSKAINHEESGVLEIPTVGLSDVDIYNCTLIYSSASESGNVDLESQHFSHQLSVVTEPVFILQIVVSYGTLGCNSEEARLMEESVSIWSEKYIAKAVVVHRATVTCNVAPQNFEDESIEEAQPKVYTLEMSVSALGVQLGMHLVSHENMKSCDTISCLEHIQAKLMEVIRDSLRKILRLPIEIKDNVGEKVTHGEVKSSLEMALVLTCLPGFALRYKLCFPCEAGFESTSANMVSDSGTCMPCPIGTFQPQPASGSCLPCPEDYSNHEKMGSTSRLDCYYGQSVVNTVVHAAHLENVIEKSPLLIGGLAGGSVLILFLLISLCLACYCPKRSCERCARRMCCCSSLNADDDQRLLGNGEDGSETESDFKSETKSKALQDNARRKKIQKKKVKR